MKTVLKYPQQDLEALDGRLKGLSWDDFRCSYHDVYEKCIAQAISEQCNECAYTEIPLPDKHQHIDHFRKKAIYQDLTFDWNNLFAAVKDKRFGADFKDGIINGNNHKQLYSTLLSPIEENIESFFSYSLDGRISVADTCNVAAKERAELTIQVFNIHADILVSRRHALILQMLEIDDKDIFAEVFVGTGFSSLVKYFAENYLG